MTFSTTLLGSLVITSDICRIGKLPKKARGLIAYLAAQRGQPVSRERLADLLWPYQGSEQASAAQPAQLPLGASQSAWACRRPPFGSRVYQLPVEGCGDRPRRVRATVPLSAALGSAGSSRFVSKRISRRFSYRVGTVSRVARGGTRSNPCHRLRRPASPSSGARYIREPRFRRSGRTPVGGARPAFRDWAASADPRLRASRAARGGSQAIQKLHRDVAARTRGHTRCRDAGAC